MKGRGTMPTLTYLSMNKPSFEAWHIYVLVAVAVACAFVLAIVIHKIRKL